MLKRIVIFSMLGVLLLPLYSQDGQLGKNSIKIELLQATVSSSIKLVYERYLKKRYSVVFSLGCNRYIGESIELDVFIGNLQVKHHLFNKYGVIPLNKLETSIMSYMQYFTFKIYG